MNTSSSASGNTPAPALGVNQGPGFNGQFHEPAIGWQLLGNGYRAYNPVLMRFHSPDNQSPFGAGGLNAYAYCQGDPLNRTDPGGHAPLRGFFKGKTFTFKQVMDTDIAGEAIFSLRPEKADRPGQWVKMGGQDVEQVLMMESYTRDAAGKLNNALQPLAATGSQRAPLQAHLSDALRRQKVYSEAARVAEAQTASSYLTGHSRFCLQRDTAIVQQRFSREGYMGGWQDPRLPADLRNRHARPQTPGHECSAIRQPGKLKTL